MAGVVVDISARIKGYEQSLEQLREAFKKLDPGTPLARSIAKALDSAEAKVRSLGKNITPKVTSDTQLDRLVDKVNNTGDAILRVSDLMSNITNQDVNFDAFGDEVKNLTQQIEALETQLSGQISSDFRDLINNSTELSDVFKNLNLDVKDKSSGEIFALIAEKAKQSVADVEQAEKDLNAATQNVAAKQAALDKLKTNPLNSADSIKASLEATSKAVTDGLDLTKIKDVIDNNLKILLSGTDNKRIEEIFTAFTGGLTRDNFSAHLTALKNDISSELATKLSAKDIYEQLLGELSGGINNGPAIAAHLAPELIKTEDLKEAFKTQVQSLYSAFTDTQSKNIELLFNKDDFEGAYKKSVEAINERYANLTALTIKAQQNLAEATTGEAAAKTNVQTAEHNRDVIDATFEKLTLELENVKQQNASLQHQIDQLKQERLQKQEEEKQQVKDTSNDTRSLVGKYKLAADEVAKYGTEVAKVQAKEQMLGRLQGVVQRWFSVYAAVRMVSNAIQSMISTIRELDKTITNIAIVTNMSQEDLWGQMPQYSAMAREYAVSISGVYEVSQLFYQQGLETADVMTLTGETLKLARIAGIDYGDATNYMTNALRSFKMEMQDAGRVTDVYSALAASSATSVNELAEAMSKTASSAQSVGSSLENTAAMIAVMTEATRESATNIGSALKSIISRYGEMKASPNDLISVEGEEASFNKVDKALQSVGISIKDVNGQFRDFDDVIMDLASVWDTLDNNTQRYIATIMAGNRQQSRFLALVSSYERLKQLTGIAADSEGASQSQFEKSLNSIEAKIQQLQTSLQTLYTSSGLEQAYGVMLDLGAKILEQYNNIAQAFGGGFAGATAAVGAFGAQFVSLALIVTNAFKLMKMRTQTFAREIDIIRQEEHEKELQGQQLTVYALNDSEEEKTRKVIVEAKKRTDAIMKEAYHQKRMIRGMAASGASMILSTIASTRSSQVTSDWLNIGSSALSGIGTGLMTGSVAMGIISGITQAIGPVTSLIKQATQSADEYSTVLEQAKKAQEEYNTAKQKASESTSIAKNLQTEIDKYKDLDKHKYESIEAYKAYQAQIDSLTEIYPDLIQYYNAEGQAIGLNTEKLEQYLKLKQEEARRDRLDAAAKEALVDKELLELENVTMPKTAAEVSKNAGQTSQYYKNVLYYIQEGQEPLEAINKGLPTLYGIGNKFTEEEYSQLIGIKDINDEIFKTKWEAQGRKWNNKLYKEMELSLLDYDNRNNKDWQQNYNVIANVLKDFEAYAEKKAKEKPELQLTEIWDEYAEEVLSTFDYDAQTSFIRTLLLAGVKQQLQATIGERGKQRAQAYIRTAASNGSFTDTMSALYAQQQAEDIIIAQVYNDENEYLKDTAEQANKRIEEVEQLMNDFQAQALDYGKNITEAQKDELNNTILPHIVEYSRNQLRKISKDYQLSETATDVLMKYFESEDGAKLYFEIFDEAKASLNEYIGEHLLQEEYKDTFAPTVLKQIQVAALKLEKKTQLEGYDTQEFKAAVDATNNLFQDIAVLADANEEAYALVQNLISTYGIDSLSGIIRIKSSLANANIGQDLQGSLDNLADYQDINLAPDLMAYTDSLTDVYKKLSDTIKNVSGGMTTEEARRLSSQIDGLSFTDFNQKDGKYYLEDLTKIYNAYNLLDDYFERLTWEFANTDLTTPETKDLQLLMDQAEAARNELRYLVVSNLIDQGNLTAVADFLFANVGIQDVILQALKNNTIPEEMQEYASVLVEYFNNVNKELVDNLTKALQGEIVHIDSIKESDQLLASELRLGTENVILNFANYTKEQLDDLYLKILNSTAITNETQRQELLDTIQKSKVERDVENIILEVAGSFEEMDAALAQRYIKYVLGLNNLSEAIAAGFITLNSLTGEYQITAQQFLDEIARVPVSAKTTAEVQDSLQQSFQLIADTIVEAFDNGINNVDFEYLQRKLNELNININTLGFYKAGDTWKTTLEGIEKAYNLLSDNSLINNSELLETIKRTVTETDGICENLHSTVVQIQKTQEELNNADNKNNKILKQRLDILKSIAAEQMMDEKNFAGMDAKLPAGIQSPFTYIQNFLDFQKASREAIENEFVDYNVFYGMITTLQQIAGQTGEVYTLWGQKIDSGSESVMHALTNMMTYAKGVDDKLVFDLSAIGESVEAGGTNMEDGFLSAAKSAAAGFAEFANQMATFYEKIAELEEAGGLDLSNIFTEDGKVINDETWVQDTIQKIKEFTTKLEAAGLKEDSPLHKALIDFAAGIESANIDAQEAFKKLTSLKNITANGLDFTDTDTDYFNKLLEALNITPETPVVQQVEIHFSYEGLKPEEIENIQGISDLVNKLGINETAEGQIQLGTGDGKDIFYQCALTHNQDDSVTATLGNYTATWTEADGNFDIWFKDTFIKNWKTNNGLNVDLSKILITNSEGAEASIIINDKGESITYHKTVNDSGETRYTIYGARNSSGQTAVYSGRTPEEALQNYMLLEPKKHQLKPVAHLLDANGVLSVQVNDETQTIEYTKTVNDSGVESYVLYGKNGSYDAPTLDGAWELYKLGELSNHIVSDYTIEKDAEAIHVTTVKETGDGIKYEKYLANNGASIIVKNDPNGADNGISIDEYISAEQAVANEEVGNKQVTSANQALINDIGSTVGYQILLDKSGTKATYHIGKFTFLWNENSGRTLDEAFLASAKWYSNRYGSGAVAGKEYKVGEANESITITDTDTKEEYTLVIGKDGNTSTFTLYDPEGKQIPLGSTDLPDNVKESVNTALTTWATNKVVGLGEEIPLAGTTISITDTKSKEKYTLVIGKTGEKLFSIYAPDGSLLGHGNTLPADVQSLVSSLLLSWATSRTEGIGEAVQPEGKTILIRDEDGTVNYILSLTNGTTQILWQNKETANLTDSILDTITKNVDTLLTTPGTTVTLTKTSDGYKGTLQGVTLIPGFSTDFNFVIDSKEDNLDEILEELQSDIDIAKTKIQAIGQVATDENAEEEEQAKPLVLNPNPILVDTSITLEKVKDGYIVNGTKYNTLDEAIDALTVTTREQAASAAINRTNGAIVRPSARLSSINTSNAGESNNIEALRVQASPKALYTALNKWSDKLSTELDELGDILTTYEVNDDKDNAKEYQAQIDILNKQKNAIDDLIDAIDLFTGEGQEIGVNDTGLSTNDIQNIYDNNVSDESLDDAIATLRNQMSNDGSARDAQLQSTINWLSDLKGDSSSQLSKLNDIYARTRIPYSPNAFRLALEGISVHGDFNGSQLVIPDGAGGWVHLPLASTEAKGNAQAKGTLMGELGPELYVTGGHYYVAGQNGAEFVNLPDDAIVFNHLQTKRLIKNGSTGRGTAVTNEKKATSYATGNIAMASAADLAARWRSIADLFSAFASSPFADQAKAGSGGGGGDKTAEAFTAELERWYNLLRLIEKLETEINYEEKLRSKIQSDRIINGEAIYASQKRQLDALKDEIAAHKELAALQESYYDARVKDIMSTGYKNIFTFENGIMQYNDKAVLPNGDRGGLFALAEIIKEDIYGAPKYTAKEQYELLRSWGFDKELAYSKDGKAIDFSKGEEAYTQAVEAFWEGAEALKDEMDGLQESVRDQLEAILDNEEERNKILQEIVDNQREVENKVLEAIENREQAIIDQLQKDRDVIADTADEYINGLNDQLNKERDLYKQNNDEESLRKLRRQLAILERSGGSGSQIASLRDQIASSEQDQYFDMQQKQIDAVKEASDLQVKRLDRQIELMTETLEYQKENGMLWDEVYEVMAKSPQEITSFIKDNMPEYLSNSTLQTEEELRELQSIVQQWTAYYKDVQAGQGIMDIAGTHNWDTFASSAQNRYSPVWTEENVAEARRRFAEEYAKSADPNAAGRAADDYMNSLMAQYYEAHPELKPKQEAQETTTSSSGVANTSDLYYYVNKNGTIMQATKEWAQNNCLPGSPISKNLAEVQNWLKFQQEKNNSQIETATQTGHGYIATVVDNGTRYQGKGETEEEALLDLRKKLKMKANLASQAVIAKYDSGGLNTYTGLAMLHGTKQRPESVFTAEQTHVLREDILSNKPNSLLSLLQDFRAAINNTASNFAGRHDSITIENATVQMNVESISNDYDAQRAGEQALERMLEIARKNSAQIMRR